MTILPVAVDISSDINVVCQSTNFLLNNFKPFETIIDIMCWVEITKPVKRFEFFNLL